MKVEQKQIRQWYEKMRETYNSMTEEERRNLSEWEKTQRDGHSVATSDWPGWEKYIGKRPFSERRGIVSDSVGIASPFSSICSVYEAHSYNIANTFLEIGWLLLATHTWDYGHPVQRTQETVYVLGWPKQLGEVQYP